MIISGSNGIAVQDANPRTAAGPVPPRRANPTPAEAHCQDAPRSHPSASLRAHPPTGQENHRLTGAQKVPICTVSGPRRLGPAAARNGGSCAARHPAKLLTWVSAAADRAPSRPPRGPPRSPPATAAMSGRPVSLTSCLQSPAGAVSAGCRCLPGRGSAAGRLAPGLVMASMTTRFCRGRRTAWHS